MESSSLENYKTCDTVVKFEPSRNPGNISWKKGCETAVTSADLKEMGRDERNSIEIKFLNGIAKVCIFSRLCF